MNANATKHKDTELSTLYRELHEIYKNSNKSDNSLMTWFSSLAVKHKFSLLDDTPKNITQNLEKISWFLETINVQDKKLDLEVEKILDIFELFLQVDNPALIDVEHELIIYSAHSLSNLIPFANTSNLPQIVARYGEIIQMANNLQFMAFEDMQIEIQEQMQQYQKRIDTLQNEMQQRKSEHEKQEVTLNKLLEKQYLIDKSIRGE